MPKRISLSGSPQRFTVNDTGSADGASEAAGANKPGKRARIDASAFETFLTPEFTPA